MYIVGRYPSITETFIHNEIEQLQRKGVNISILSVTHKCLRKHGQVESNYISILKNIYFLLVLPFAHVWILYKYNTAYRRLLQQILKEKEKNRKLQLKSLISASVFVFLLRKNHFELIHAHFINSPSFIGIFMSEFIKKPFSCTAHANDIYLSGKESIKYVYDKASFMVTCTAFNKTHIEKTLEAGHLEKLYHIYHGIDLETWRNNKPTRITDPNHKVKILSIGRLVPKKGFHILLNALKMIRNENSKFECLIIGDGHLRGSLNEQIISGGMTEYVRIEPSLPNKDLKSFYECFDIFVLPCIQTENGDIDGLPNVLLEAMAMGLPIISSMLSAIPELVEHNHSGLLIKSGDATALKDALLLLFKSESMRTALSENGRLQIKKFGIEQSINQLEILIKNHIKNHISSTFM